MSMEAVCAALAKAALTGGGAGLDAGDPRRGVDADALHLREIDREGVVDDTEGGQAVTATAHRQP